MFTLWQSEGDPDDDSVEKIAVSQFEIVGGSGTGGGTSNKLYIYYDKDTGGNNINKYVFRTEEVSESNAKIYYEFIGEDPAGDSVSYGDATWQIRKGTSGAWTTIATETIYPSGDTPN